MEKIEEVQVFADEGVAVQIDEDRRRRQRDGVRRAGGSGLHAPPCVASHGLRQQGLVGVRADFGIGVMP